ncbi:hypothetical protein AMTRI_Chr01g135180 [Amborella trichopoda]
MLIFWIAFKFKSKGLLNVWHSLFLTTVWMLWEEQNYQLFQAKESKWEHLLRRIISHIREMADAKAWSFHLSEKAIHPIPIARSCPRPNHFQLNVDGAPFQNLGFAGGGGIIRGEDGSFIVAFGNPFGVASNII